MRKRISQSYGTIVPAALLLLLALMLAWPVSAQTNSSTPVIRSITGFNVPGDFYDPPFQAQPKSVIEGAKAQALGENRFQLNQLKLTTFQTNGEPEMIVEAADCLFDNNEHVASSGGPLTVRMADGRFFLEGQGFRWVERDSILVISNRVHSTLHKISSETNALNNGGDIEVFSDSFTRNLKTGQSVYRDNVRVVGTNVSLSANELALALPMTNDVITLQGGSTWASGTRNGGADALEINRVSNLLRAHGHAFVKMPGSAIGTNSGSMNKSVEVFADDYELRSDAARFTGDVHVTQMVAGKPAGKMNCGAMNVTLSPAGEIQSLVAEKNVLVEQDDGHFTGDRAVFSATNPVVQFSGHPTWSSGERSGAGDVLLVNQSRSEMAVHGNAHMKIPGNALANGTNAVTGDKFTTITSDDYTLKAGRAEFRGNVSIEDSQMKITSDLLTADSPTGGANIERIIADQNVKADLPDSEGKITHVSGQHALYTMKDGLLRLTGAPVVQNDQGWLTGSIIVWDRNYDLLIARNQRMVFRAPDSKDNGLLNFQTSGK